MHLPESQAIELEMKQDLRTVQYLLLFSLIQILDHVPNTLIRSGSCWLWLDNLLAILSLQWLCWLEVSSRRTQTLALSGTHTG